MANSLFNWLMAGMMAVLHPFLVGKVEISHNAKDKSMEITMKVFTDDLEQTLKKFGKTNIDLTNNTNKEATDKIITNYVRQKLQLKVDGKAAMLDYVGYEISKESTWLYFEVKNVPTVKKVDIDCSLLYDYQDKQMNILQVKANGKEENYKLDYPKTNVSFSF